MMYSFLTAQFSTFLIALKLSAIVSFDGALPWFLINPEVGSANASM